MIQVAHPHSRYHIRLRQGLQFRLPILYGSGLGPVLNWSTEYEIKKKTKKIKHEPPDIEHVLPYTRWYQMCMWDHSIQAQFKRTTRFTLVCVPIT